MKATQLNCGIAECNPLHLHHHTIHIPAISLVLAGLHHEGLATCIPVTGRAIVPSEWLPIIIISREDIAPASASPDRVVGRQCVIRSGLAVIGGILAQRHHAIRVLPGVGPIAHSNPLRLQSRCHNHSHPNTLAIHPTSSVSQIYEDLLRIKYYQISRLWIYTTDMESPL